MARRTAFALVLALLACCLSGSLQSSVPKASQLRGVHPDRLAHYQPGAGGSFTCVDGSKLIPFDFVNDDFCDCPDGSDEPGTSACPNGSFHCRNMDMTPKTISSSFVHDGVCDCCDGSDEPRGACANTCLEHTKAMIAGVRRKYEDHQRGLELKAEMAAQGAAKRDELAQQLARAEGEVEAQRSLVASLTEEVAALREAEAQVAAEAAAAEAAAAPEAAVAELSEQAGGGAGDSSEQASTPSDASEAAGGAEGSDAAGGSEQAAVDGEGTAEGTAPHEETPEERGRRIASQWTNDPEAAAAGGAAGGVHDAAEAMEEPLLDGHDYEPHHDGGEEEHPVVDEEWGEGGSEEDGKLGILGWAAAKAKHLASKVFGGSKTSRFGHLGSKRRAYQPPAYQYTPPAPATPAEEAAGRLRDAESRLSTLQFEISDLQEKLARDYGPGDLFLALMGQCLETKAGQYTYEACFFDSATQKEGYNRAGIGKWAGLREGNTVALFDNGDYCWEGPNRSFRLSLACGGSNALSEASEPEKCVYTATLTTPAACTEEEADKLRAEVEDSERLQSQLEALVAAAAAAPHDEL